MKLNKATDEYLELRWTLSAKSKLIYSEHLQRLAKALKNPELDAITEVELVRFLSGLRKRDGSHYASSYVHQVYRSMSTFFTWAVERELLANNPMRRIDAPRLHNGPKPRLTDDQIRILLGIVRRTENPKRDSAIVTLMLDSGLRRNEVANLTAANVRLDARRVTVYDRKTGKSREVPISSPTIRAIQAYINVRPSFRATNEAFFVSKSGPFTASGISQLFKRLRRLCGFPLTPHLLRHTFAQVYIQRGEIRKLQKILGHTRVDTTARFYTDPDFADLQREHDQVSPLAQLSECSRDIETVHEIGG